MMGGLKELHIANPKKYMSLKFYYAPKIPGIQMFNPKNTRLKSTSTGLFNQADFKN